MCHSVSLIRLYSSSTTPLVKRKAWDISAFFIKKNDLVYRSILRWKLLYFILFFGRRKEKGE
jgi:hypothetical protein